MLTDGSEADAASATPMRSGADGMPSSNRCFSTVSASTTIPRRESFFHYVKRCQIETTMPFNDYWTEPPALADAHKWLVGGLVASVVLAGLLP